MKYPIDQYRAGIESDVCLSVTVGTKGEVLKVEVKKSGGKTFDTAAIAAAEKYTFTPATIDDLPVVVKVKLNIPFRIAKKQSVDKSKTAQDNKTDIKKTQPDGQKSDNKEDNKTGKPGTEVPSDKTENRLIQPTWVNILSHRGTNPVPDH
ncbi:MAG: energy transducer TonB [Deltaproteobacteria bacterium]|nr:energy transducer TonB [Deltaproteobacteria bacterium]